MNRGTNQMSKARKTFFCQLSLSNVLFGHRSNVEVMEHWFCPICHLECPVR